jgi:hypothetical protein
MIALRAACDRAGCEAHCEVDLAEAAGVQRGGVSDREGPSLGRAWIEADVTVLLPEGWRADGTDWAGDRPLVFCPEHR